jgi:hypothetical protein
MSFNHTQKKAQSLLRKVFHGLDNDHDSWGWDSTGSRFFIKNEKTFASVLFRLIGNRRVQQFIQQLLHLGFYKDPHIVEYNGESVCHSFSHPYFLRGFPELLSNIHKIGSLAQPAPPKTSPPPPPPLPPPVNQIDPLPSVLPQQFPDHLASFGDINFGVAPLTPPNCPLSYPDQTPRHNLELLPLNSRRYDEFRQLPTTNGVSNGQLSQLDQVFLSFSLDYPRNCISTHEHPETLLSLESGTNETANRNYPETNPFPSLDSATRVNILSQLDLAHASFSDLFKLHHSLLLSTIGPILNQNGNQDLLKGSDAISTSPSMKNLNKFKSSAISRHDTVHLNFPTNSSYQPCGIEIVRSDSTQFEPLVRKKSKSNHHDSYYDFSNNNDLVSLQSPLSGCFDCPSPLVSPRPVLGSAGYIPASDVFINQKRSFSQMDCPLEIKRTNSPQGMEIQKSLDKLLQMHAHFTSMQLYASNLLIDSLQKLSPSLTHHNNIDITSHNDECEPHHFPYSLSCDQSHVKSDLGNEE